jgi:hypothetical protein
LKPTWVVDKELDRMGVPRLGLLTYDYKSTWSLGLWSGLGISPKATLTNNPTHKLVQFCSCKWVGHGKTGQSEWVVTQQLLHSKVMLMFWYHLHKMEQVWRFRDGIVKTKEPACLNPNFKNTMFWHLKTLKKCKEFWCTYSCVIIN